MKRYKNFRIKRNLEFSLSNWRIPRKYKKLLIKYYPELEEYLRSFKSRCREIRADRFCKNMEMPIRGTYKWRKITTKKDEQDAIRMCGSTGMSLVNMLYYNHHHPDNKIEIAQP